MTCTIDDLGTLKGAHAGNVARREAGLIALDLGRRSRRRTLLRQYRELPIVAAFSSLSTPDDVVTWLTRRGIYAIAMGDEAMQVLNLDEVRGVQPSPA